LSPRILLNELRNRLSHQIRNRSPFVKGDLSQSFMLLRFDRGKQRNGRF